MGVISVRLNKDEDRMLKCLSEHFNADKSTLIKRSLFELYETMRDNEVIDAFEIGEDRGRVSFFTSEDILKDKD